MAKKTSLESKTGAAKRKSSEEAVVCVEENMQSKVKKKKKTEREEVVPQLEIPEISVIVDDDTDEKTLKKHKQTSEPTKKKKKKRKEIVETPTDPVVTQAGQEEGEEDLSPEERRVLERKMKKILKKEEKDKLKDERKTEEKVVEAPKPIAPQQALEYLTCWAENRKQWKFQKTRQTWLLQHMFDAEKIPDESFSVLLTYLEGLQGGARDTTVQKAEALVQKQGEGTAEEDSVLQQRTHRAREVVQLLS